MARTLVVHGIPALTDLSKLMPNQGPVLVCGLGALGQACLQRLLRFGVPLRCLDLEQPIWRDPSLQQQLDATLTVGDMRFPRVLEEASVRQCRAVLLLSSNSTANFEAALQVRLLNPSAEIVVRSTSQQASLGTLLEQKLPGIAVIDPILLCAGAFTTALRPGDGPASLEIDGETYLLRQAPWQDHQLEKPIRLPQKLASSLPVLLEPRSLHRTVTANRRWQSVSKRLTQNLRWLPMRSLMAWRSRSLLQQMAILLLMMLLWIGVHIFSRFQGWTRGLFITLALLKGEYVDPVNVLLGGDLSAGAPNTGLIIITLAYSLVGTLITSAIVAVILERLLRERLGYRRPHLTERDRQPVLLVEGDDLAREISSRLKRQGRSVVRVVEKVTDICEPHALVFEQLDRAVQELKERDVSAIGLLSTDLLHNLQEALALQQRWPKARVAMLAHAFGASEQLGELLGGLAVISSVDLVADAVVARAFGERVEGVLQVRGLNLLIVRYLIRSDDSLCGLGLARLENGYGFTVVSLKRAHHSEAILLPAPELVVTAGDQLVVLATAETLRRVELGAIVPPRLRLRLRFALQGALDWRFEIQHSLARWIGCSPANALSLLDGEECITPPLDEEICELLSRELQRQGVICELESAPLESRGI
jgi:Trk K+ transport system NAD-binding subunit